MKKSTKTAATFVVATVIIFLVYKPVKKYITEHPLINDIHIEMFNDINSTTIGDVGDVQGDFNVNN